MHPAPRDTAQKWLAFGAIAAVAVGVSVGAAAFKSRLNESLPQVEPPVTATPHFSTPPTPKNAAPSEIDPNTPPVDDGPAPLPGTPQSSLKARPPWGRLELTTRGEATTQYAPQHSKPLDLYVKSSPLNGDVLRAFVICRAQSFNEADTFAGDDLHVRATFGKTPEVAQDGPEDANLGFVSAPLVSLTKNEIVHVAVFDRDVFELTNLSRVNVTYQGTAIVVADPGASIECRSLAGNALSARVATDAGGADREIASIARTRLDGGKSDWGYPHSPIALAYRGTGDVAALVGWDDPRTQKRVKATYEAIAKIEEQYPPMFDKLRGEAANETTVDAVTATLAGVECGARVGLAGRCAVKLTIVNGTSAPIRWNKSKGPHAYVALANSGPIAVSPKDGDVVLRDIAPGARLDITLLTPDDRPGRALAILGVCVDHCGVIKLR